MVKNFFTFLPNREKLIREGNDRRFEKAVPYLFILPFLLSFFVFFLFPAIYSLYISLCKYQGFGPMKFVGFSNYKSLFQFDFFWKSLLNTLFYFIAHSLPVMVLSFLLAVAISSKIVRWKSFYKICFFLPVTMSSVSATLIWKVILSTRSGAINSILGTQIPFLDNTVLFRWSVVFIIIWKSVGYYMMIYIAGLTTVNHEIYEAARVDGASAFRTLVSVTIPIMKPIFLFAIIMDTMSSLKLFTEPRLLSAVESISPEANTLVGILVDNMNGGMFGMASAVGWTLFIMISAVSLMQYRILSNRSDEK